MGWGQSLSILHRGSPLTAGSKHLSTSAYKKADRRLSKQRTQLSVPYPQRNHGDKSYNTTLVLDFHHGARHHIHHAMQSIAARLFLD